MPRPRRRPRARQTEVLQLRAAPAWLERLDRGRQSRAAVGGVEEIGRSEYVRLAVGEAADRDLGEAELRAARGEVRR